LPAQRKVIAAFVFTENERVKKTPAHSRAKIMLALFGTRQNRRATSYIQTIGAPTPYPLPLSKIAHPLTAFSPNGRTSEIPCKMYNWRSSNACQRLMHSLRFLLYRYNARKCKCKRKELPCWSNRPVKRIAHQLYVAYKLHC